MEMLENAILVAAGSSEQQGIDIARQLARTGQYFQAARCLEVTSQRWLGLEPTGLELTGFQHPDFGDFHRRVLSLLEAGQFYVLAQRPRTAQAMASRALVFVEEALRRTEKSDEDEQGALCCLALGFELAGHCSLGCRFLDGAAYYQASLGYWDRAVRMRPEKMPHWTQHPVLDVVLDCLGLAGEIQGQTLEMARDYSTRLEAAMGFLKD